jgi:hypothetical protein
VQLVTGRVQIDTGRVQIDIWARTNSVGLKKIIKSVISHP